jgi:hypothetical protein
MSGMSAAGEVKCHRLYYFAIRQIAGAFIHKHLENIADHPINKVDELLPWCVSKLLQSSLRSVA